MKRLLCWLFGHSYINVGFIPDEDSQAFPVNVLCQCARCNRRGWDAVSRLVKPGFVPLPQSTNLDDWGVSP